MLQTDLSLTALIEFLTINKKFFLLLFRMQLNLPTLVTFLSLLILISKPNTSRMLKGFKYITYFHVDQL